MLDRSRASGRFSSLDPVLIDTPDRDGHLGVSFMGTDLNDSAAAVLAHLQRAQRFPATLTASPGDVLFAGNGT
jgi:hypothetical protein